MKSIHPTFQQVTRQGTLFGEAVKGGPKPGGKKKASKPAAKKSKKPMKKKAARTVFRMSGDANDETNPKFRDVPKHLKKLWRETPTETKAKAGAASAGGLAAALLARKFLKKKAAAAGGKLQEAVLKGATSKQEVTGQAGDRVDLNDSSARYGGGLGNLKGTKAPSFTDKVNPTDKPGVFRKMDKIASPFLSSFLDEFIKVSQSQAVRSAMAGGVPEASRQSAMAREKGKAVSAKRRVGSAAAQSARMSSTGNRLATTAQKLEGTGLSAFGKGLRQGASKLHRRAGSTSMGSMPDVAKRNKAKKRYEALERMGPRAQ